MFVVGMGGPGTWVCVTADDMTHIPPKDESRKRAATTCKNTVVQRSDGAATSKTVLRKRSTDSSNRCGTELRAELAINRMTA